MKDLELQTKAALAQLCQGWGDPVQLDNIKIELDEDENDFYDSQINVRKKIYVKWEIMDSFFFSRYMEDSFFNYEKMENDILECVKQHYETPKKKGWD